jgi:hypothetical protein
MVVAADTAVKATKSGIRRGRVRMRRLFPTAVAETFPSSFNVTLHNERARSKCSTDSANVFRA